MAKADQDPAVEEATVPADDDSKVESKKKKPDKSKDDNKSDVVAEDVEATDETDDTDSSEVKDEVADKVETKAVTVKKRRFGGFKNPLAGAGSRTWLTRLVAVVVALGAIALVVFGVLIYYYRSENPAVRTVAKVVPYPVQQVNGRFVSYGDYLFEVDANKRAYQNNAKLNGQSEVDFNSDEGKKLLLQIKQHALEKLKDDALVAQLASQRNVKVTDKEVDDLLSQLYERYGGKDTLLKTLNDIYGWNVEDLRRVLRKQILAKNLETNVTADKAADEAAKAKATEVLDKVKNGADFGDLAKQYSQASDAANGGDLGFFTKGQLPDNVQAAAEALQPNQVSDVIKTDYGYEILKVVEKKDDGSIHGLHVLIKTIDFNDYFQEQLDKAKTKTFIKVS